MNIAYYATLYFLIGLLITLPLAREGIEDGDTYREAGPAGLIFIVLWPMLVTAVGLSLLGEIFGKWLISQAGRRRRK